MDCIKGKMPMDAVIDDRESPKPEEEDPTHHLSKPNSSMMLNMGPSHTPLSHHKSEIRDQDHVIHPVSIPQSLPRHHQPLLGKFKRLKLQSGSLIF